MWASWSRTFRERVSRAEYLRCWREEASQLRPAFDPQTPAGPFLALHLRRGDKSHPNVPLVDAETRRIVERCVARHPRWAIMSDAPETAAAFATFITARGGTVLTPRDGADGAAAMLREFFWITRAAGVVQSVGQQGSYGGFSSFSYLPARMADIPLIACVPRAQLGDTRYQDYARANGARLDGIFYNDEVGPFLRRVGGWCRSA